MLAVTVAVAQAERLSVTRTVSVPADPPLVYRRDVPSMTVSAGEPVPCASNTKL